MLWSDFKAAVKVNLPVDNKRLNIATGNPNFLDQQILHAVIMIQKQVLFYQQGHETVYGQSDLVMEGMASVGSLPQYDQCRPVDGYYKKVGQVCVSQPLTTYDWGNRYDLICGSPRMSNCQFFIAIDPHGKTFTVFPSVGVGHQINLNWDGVKANFNDTDIVPFEEDVVEAVSIFCKARIALMVDHDTQEHAIYMQEWKFLKAHLYADTRDRVRLNNTGRSPDPGMQCGNRLNSCVSPIAGEDTVSLCIFGDSGELTTIENTEAVSNLVKALEPDYVLHLGDIVYPHGEPENIQDALLHYYQMYLPNNMFWSPGNHDVETDGGTAIQALFGRQNTFNGGKRYWDFIPQENSAEQPLHIFVLDTELSSPLDEQMSWLQSKLAVSSEFWNVVCFHKPPYTSDSSHYPGETAFRQPYKDWGAHLVIGAHGHNYERLYVDGLTYIVSGLGGMISRGFVDTPVAGSQFRYNDFYGTVYLGARRDRLTVSFYNTLGDVVDSVALEHATVLA